MNQIGICLIENTVTVHVPQNLPVLCQQRGIYIQKTSCHCRIMPGHIAIHIQIARFYIKIFH